MTYDEMTNAVDDAANTMRMADIAATRIAKLLVGRLRKVSSGVTLAELKRELRDYNIHTAQWNDTP